MLRVCPRLPQAHQLVVRNSIDDKANDEENKTDNEPRVVEVALAVLRRADELCIDVRVEQASEKRRERNPESEFVVAVSRNQRSHKPSLHKVDDVEAEEDNVWCIAVVLPGQEVGQDEENDIGYEVDNHSSDSCRHW